MASIVGFLIILSVLVLVHELGHFWAARRFGIKVEEFGIGYPPRLLAKKIKGTVYSLNWLFFGGFVRMLGEDYDAKIGKKDLNQAFFSQKKSKRTVVLLAGVAMNFLLGVLLFATIYTKLGIPETVDYIRVVAVASNSPAETAGLKPDDRIIGQRTTTEFIDWLNQNRGQEVEFSLADGREIKVVPRPVELTPEGEGALGAVISNYDLIQYPFWQRPFRGIWVGLKEALAWGGDILSSLARTLVQVFQGQLPKDVAGPVGIYQISREVIDEGLIATLQFMAILTVNLAILNLLPLPALDGGRLLFVGIEALTKRRVNPKLEQKIHLIGVALLLALMVLITINDIRRLLG
jgi:regulator of sigma E protease